jgi:aldehyde:ferredoxin oxidoreductase
VYGWTGKLLRVDLTKKEIREENIPQEILSNFLGGKGLATFYLYQEVPAGTDPLGPENKFILATGPIQGTRIPITGRCIAVSKSPLTGLYIDSNVGGHLGPELKRTGYDMVIIQGQATSPVWIQINSKEANIQNATHLWGKTTQEVESHLRSQDYKIRVLSIGPAGEKVVKIASLNHDYFRTLGRGGLGAVWGAKHLKALTVLGQPEMIPTPDKTKELDLVKNLAKRARTAKEKGHSLHYHGTPWLVEYSNSVGMLPTMNFQATQFEEVKGITAEGIEAATQEKLRRMPCEGCVISCSWTIHHSFSWMKPNKKEVVAKPEYETLAMMGSNLGISDAETVIRLNHQCNLQGLDTISTGNVLGLLMELTERELLPQNLKAEGIHFGDTQGAIELIQKITDRKGIGTLLADGAQQLAHHLGKDTLDYAIHGKGLEYPAWDPRGKLGLGLSYATAAAGASHLRGWPRTRDIPNKSAVTVLDSLILEQNLKILKDSLIICHFTHSISPRLSIPDCSTIFETATGHESTPESITKIADRIWILARLFNIREYTESPRSYDHLPPRFLKEPVPNGPTKGCTAFVNPKDFETSLTELYHRRGCDTEGRPSKTTLSQLGLTKWL